MIRDLADEMEADRRDQMSRSSADLIFDAASSGIAEFLPARDGSDLDRRPLPSDDGDNYTVDPLPEPFVGTH